jgi:hypothetical protein
MSGVRDSLPFFLHDCYNTRHDASSQDSSSYELVYLLHYTADGTFLFVLRKSSHQLTNKPPKQLKLVPFPVCREHGRRHVRRVRRPLGPARLAIDRVGRELRELRACQPRYARTCPACAALNPRS